MTKFELFSQTSTANTAGDQGDSTKDNKISSLSLQAGSSQIQRHEDKVEVRNELET